MKNGQLGHLYFGKAIKHCPDFSRFQRYDIPIAASCHPYLDDPAFSLENVRQEYPSYGNSDFREPAINVSKYNDMHIPTFKYQSFEITAGKPKLKGLPATFVKDFNKASTLKIHLRDDYLQANLTLIYTIFSDLPIITRSVLIENKGNEALCIKRIMSAALDLPDKDFHFIHLAGAWGRERHVKVRKLDSGIQSISSLRGASSHHHNPFLALKRLDATEHYGEVYGFNLVYSSNFLIQAEVDHYDVTRILLGIHPFGFEWKLPPQDTFQTPEVVMVFSDKGLNGMSQAFHNLYRQHLIQSQWAKVDRPILLNSWEATYFNFNEDKLIRIAKAAKGLGIELFVLDDGWFGNRNDDKSSLGDWFANSTKLPNGIEGLAKKIKELGLKFGLWIEPEMVSPDSELYRNHPDWVVGIPHLPKTFGRNQLVLDFSRPEIVDYLYETISKIIKRTGLSYIKWDMNRYITEAYSSKLDKNQQGEFFHRYILGVYRLYEKLTKEFPDVLIESCAGGGGRFDPGILHYAPQGWASDNTDAIERLKIQYGTSYAYPIYSIGSHVSAVPNHQTMRTVGLSTRANTAYFGSFGYELDPMSLTEKEYELIKEQIAFYKKHRHLIREGDFYRLINPFQNNEAAWMVVSNDQSEAIVGWYKILATPNPPKQQNLKLKGLDPTKPYKISGYNQIYYGDELMYIGLSLPIEFNGVNQQVSRRGGDFQSYIFHIKSNE
jgi:alpha-galactosidase